jgi:hypothetical protein
VNPTHVARGLVVAVAVGLTGCGTGPPPPTDKAEAVAVLRTALEAWQSGGTADALKAGPAAITAVDSAWAAGTKLARFEIDEAGAQPSGYDLSCPVQLWLGDGKKPPVKVRYVIALTPNRVVTRDFGS